MREEVWKAGRRGQRLGRLTGLSGGSRGWVSAFRDMASDRPSSYEERFRSLGLEFPTLPPTAARIVAAVRVDRLIFASGQTPHRAGSLVHVGKLGRDVTIQEGQNAARLAALNCLTQVRELLGSLDLIERIVRVTGYVASAEGFSDQALVVNGLPSFSKRSSARREGTRGPLSALPSCLAGLPSKSTW